MAYGGAKVYIPGLLASILGMDEWPALRPDRLNHGEKSPYSWHRRLGTPQSLSGRCVGQNNLSELPTAARPTAPRNVLDDDLCRTLHMTCPRVLTVIRPVIKPLVVRSVVLATPAGGRMIPTAWRDWGSPRETLAIIASVSAEILTQNLSNTNPER